MNESLKILRKLQPVLGERAKRLWHIYQASDFKKRRELEQAINILAARYLKVFDNRIYLEPIPKDQCPGDYYLSEVTYLGKEQYPFYLREEDLSMHCGLFGVTGCGKTNAAYILVSELLKKEKPFLILDWKRNFRKLLSRDDLRDKLLIFTLGGEKNNFYFNPLIPPKNVDPRVWLNLLTEIICHAYFCGEGVMHILRNTIDQAYRDFGVYVGQKNYPTFKDIQKYMDKMFMRKGRKMLWMDTSDRVTGSMIFAGGLGNIVNVKIDNQIPLEELLNRHVVLELDNLINADKVFIIETLLLWTYQYKLQNGNKEKLDSLIVIEEAHNILRKSELKRESIIELMFRQLRELGIGIVYITQNISKIPITALQNTFTIISFNQRHKLELDTVAKIMLLNKEDKELLGKLRIGEAVIKGRYENPFTTKFPLFLIKKENIPDKAVRELMQRNYEKLGLNNARIENSGKNSLSSSEHILSPLEKIMLIDIHKKPFYGMIKRYRKLSLNDFEGNKTKDELIKRGLVKPVKVNRLKLLELTEQGINILSQLGNKINKSKKRESLEHRYWVHRIGNYFQNKGFQVEKEKDNIDLVANQGDIKIAIEVETGESDFLANIRNCLNKDFDKIISAATNKEAEIKIRQKLEETGIIKEEKIALCHVKQFFIEPKGL